MVNCHYDTYFTSPETFYLSKLSHQSLSQQNPLLLKLTCTKYRCLCFFFIEMDRGSRQIHLKLNFILTILLTQNMTKLRNDKCQVKTLSVLIVLILSSLSCALKGQSRAKHKAKRLPRLHNYHNPFCLC